MHPDKIDTYLSPYQINRFALFRLTLIFALLIVSFLVQVAVAENYRERFNPVIPGHYIAVLANPDATSGDHAETWGYWPLDPGPRGVKLKNYDQLLVNDNVAPAGWKFESDGWWVEENGLIMEAPDFPLAPGEYLVTGGRMVLSALKIFPADETGNQRWELEHGASIYDVTHLGCRSAIYTQAEEGTPCSPANVPRDVFRVTPGEPMPEVAGCNKQDYAVLIVVGLPK